MEKRAGCLARQYSDQMHCAACALTWDVNDSNPPACRQKPFDKFYGDEAKAVTADSLRRLANKFRGIG